MYVRVGLGDTSTDTTATAFPINWTGVVIGLVGLAFAYWVAPKKGHA